LGNHNGALIDACAFYNVIMKFEEPVASTIQFPVDRCCRS
jgi:hypothetical protein